jgi:alpha-tubulin suppressor-like RCC1 family protein
MLKSWYALLQGEVYVAGLGDAGQLGLGCRKAIAQHPALVNFQYADYTIVQITAGIAHNSKRQQCMCKA